MRKIGGQPFELIVPVVGAGKQAVHHADQALPAGTSLDDPLGGHSRRAGRAHGGLGGEAPRRIPRGDRGGAIHAWPEVGYDLSPLALLHPRGDEPG